jgi:hypothetical protein
MKFITFGEDYHGGMWGNFLSLYSRFYEVIILESTYATNEKKIQNVFLDVKLCL